jgi:hypothetical protein
MKILMLLVSPMCMFSTKLMVAQKKNFNAIEWSIAAELPAGNGQVKALGLAGPSLRSASKCMDGWWWRQLPR